MGVDIYYFYHRFGLKAFEGRHIRMSIILRCVPPICANDVTSSHMRRKISQIASGFMITNLLRSFTVLINERERIIRNNRSSHLRYLPHIQVD